MDKSQVEAQVREFVGDELMRDDLKEVSSGTELELDSLDLTELRVFVEEKFAIDPSKLDLEKMNSYDSIASNICKFL